MPFDLDPNYKQVPERIAEFKAKHPEGCLRPADPAQPYRVETIGDKTFIVYIAAAYRTPDDPAPGAAHSAPNADALRAVWREAAAAGVLTATAPVPGGGTAVVGEYITARKDSLAEAPDVPDPAEVAARIHAEASADDVTRARLLVLIGEAEKDDAVAQAVVSGRLGMEPLIAFLNDRVENLGRRRSA